MYKNFFLGGFLCLSFCCSTAQIPEKEDDSIVNQHVKFTTDTTYGETINLEEVIIFEKLRFKNHEERVRYYLLRRKTLKVYPYAKLAGERFSKLNELTSLKTKKEKRRYIRTMQRYIKKTFSKELKKLSRTEGQILIKLIYRQTGVTVFDLVKELKSGWRAFWYNSTARMFQLSLKKKYDPVNVEEDYLIEGIIQRAFSSGRLEKQPTALDFDYASLYNKW